MERSFIEKSLIFGLICMCFMLSNTSISQDSLKTKQNFLSRMYFPDSTQTFRYRITPVLNYSPETRLGIGAGAILNWNYKNAKEGTNSSHFQSFLFFTQNNQIDWTSLYDIYTNENRFFLSGKIGYIKFPQNYYGVGNDIDSENSEKFSFQQFYIDLRNRIKIGKGFYFGVDYYFNKNYDVKWEEGSKFEYDSTLYGTEGYLVSGLGPEIAYDTRDFPAAPTKGSFLSASVLFFTPSLGSQYTYQYFQTDFRHYFLMNKKKSWVLAVNFIGLFSLGEVPFNRLPALGGPQIMRGYYSGRYRDHNYIALQMEWRMPIWKMFSLAVWTGAGQVSAKVNQFYWDGFKPNFGVGLRIEFDQKSKTRLRLDQGFGRDSRGFYFRINEAF